MKPVAILREADANRQAPDHVETRLRAAFREKHSRPKRVLWFAASIAVVSAGVILAVIRLNTSVAERPLVALPIPPAPAVESVAVTPRPEAEPLKRRRRSRTVPKTETASTEEFYRIPYAPPLEQTDRGEVVRVHIPGQSIRSLGIPVNADRMFERIPADILMGEDGVPRAIRLVHAQ